MLRLLLVYCSFFFCVTALSAEGADRLEELGWIENVRIFPGEIELGAKLDTGADHCSLHASDIDYFQQGKDRYVRFTIRNRKGEEITLERKVHRYASIRRVEGGKHHRPVVQLFLCLGSKLMKVDVNLADRSQLAYPMLIGRSFLAGNITVDSSKTYSKDPRCSLP